MTLKVSKLLFGSTFIHTYSHTWMFVWIYLFPIWHQEFPLTSHTGPIVMLLWSCSQFQWDFYWKMFKMIFEFYFAHFIVLFSFSLTKQNSQTDNSGWLFHFLWTFTVSDDKGFPLWIWVSNDFFSRFHFATEMSKGA